ncbi:hypothetical protein HG531_008002 [Fusarium graminearum]|nr:hypothetical protein HG531_008002 [Fusarium graminearum]
MALSRSLFLALRSSSSQSSPSSSLSSSASEPSSSLALLPKSEPSSLDSDSSSNSSSSISKADSSSDGSPPSSSESACRKDQPPSAKNWWVSAVTVFMMVVLDLVEKLDGNSVDVMGDFNFLNGDYHKGRLNNLNKAVGGGLNKDVASEWHAVESKFADRHVNLDTFVTTSLGDLLREALEQAVQLGSSSAFLLLCLELVFVTISVLALAVTRFIELDVCCFSVELDILCLLLIADNNRILEFILLNDVLHILLLLLLLDYIALHIGDLSCYFVVSLTIGRSEGQTSDKMRRGILERLVILPTYTLARGQEVDTQERPFTFVALTSILDGVDMERHRASHYRQNDCAVLAVNNNLEVLNLDGELVVSLVGLEALELLNLASVLIICGFRESRKTFPLLLGCKFFLMLTSLLLDIVISDLSSPTQERVGISTCGRLGSENHRLRRSNSDGISQDQGVDFAVLVLRVRVLDILKTCVDDKGHAVLQNSLVLRVENEGGVLVLQSDTPTNVLEEMLLHFRLLALDDTNSPSVHLLCRHAITNFLDDVRLVSETHSSNDDACVEVVVVGLAREPKIVLAATLDRWSQNPVQLSRIELLVDLVGQRGMLDFLFGVKNVGHLVEEVGGHQGNTGLGGSSHRSEFTLILDGKGRTTYSCLLNLIGELDEKLLILRSVLASHEHFDRESAAFELFEMFG